MKRTLSIAIVAIISSLMLVSLITYGFTATEKKTIREFRQRIIALEANDVVLDQRIASLEQRVATLEATPAPTPAPFVFSGINAIVGPECGPGQCYTDIEWNVEPCATGQVEWGLTTDYGNFTTYEPRLLCYHKQRIRGLDPDTVYHFRIWATDGEVGGQAMSVSVAS